MDDIRKDQFPLYRYRGVVRSVYDGDTLSVTLDLGDWTYRWRSIRLLGYNSPEIRPLATRAAGTRARDALAALAPVGSTIYMETVRDAESYDRLLAWVWVEGTDGWLVPVAPAMLRGGYGVP